MKVKRKYYPDEKIYRWLTPLLDAYKIHDQGLKSDLKKEPNKEQIACRKGCHSCCLQHAIPVNNFEVMGMAWFASQHISSLQRDKLISNIKHSRQSLACPFLVDESCSIYPVRPLACRGFHILGNICEIGEDPIESRPGDIWFPSRNTTKKTAFAMMATVGIINHREKEQKFNDDFMLKITKQLHEVEITEVLELIAKFDKKIAIE
jgi:uncharacterized protein